MVWLSALIFHSLFLFSRLHLYMWRDIKREKWDHRKSGFSSRISQWSELYVGCCSRGEEQNSYSFSILCCGGRIWLFIFIRRTSSSCQLQNEASHVDRHCERGSVGATLIKSKLDFCGFYIISFRFECVHLKIVKKKDCIQYLQCSLRTSPAGNVQLIYSRKPNYFTRWRFFT